MKDDVSNSEGRKQQHVDTASTADQRGGARSTASGTPPMMRHGVDCYSRSDWHHECDCGLQKDIQGLVDAARQALALLDKGASGWGVSKDLLRSALHKIKTGTLPRSE